MSVLKNIKDRLIAFIVGVVFTVAGAIMLYYDFFGKKEVYTSTLTYSIPAFFIGIAAILIAFSKKKPYEPEKDSSPPTLNDSKDRSV